MGNHHDAFKALYPVHWTDVPQDDLKAFLDDIFTDAHTIVESVPSPTSTAIKSSAKTAETGRARAKTDSAVDNAVPGRMQSIAGTTNTVKLHPSRS